MRCNNCGKLKKNHYESTENNEGGDWCYIHNAFPPKDERYFSKFEPKKTSAIQEEINGVARIIEQLESDYSSFVVKEAIKLRKHSLNHGKVKA